MSQTVLTIPITQPGSPPSPSTPSQSQLSHHPHLTGHSLPPNPGGNKRTHHSTHHHQIPTGGIPTLPHPHSRSLHHPQSPSIAPTAATLQKQSRNRDSLSPDYPHDRARTLLGLGSHSHLVGQPLGGHIMPTVSFHAIYEFVRKLFIKFYECFQLYLPRFRRSWLWITILLLLGVLMEFVMFMVKEKGNPVGVVDTTKEDPIVALVPFVHPTPVRAVWVALFMIMIVTSFQILVSPAFLWRPLPLFTWASVQ